MRSRFLIVLVSLLFAAVATFGAAYYIANLKASIVEGQELTEVLVAKSPVQAGTSVTEMAGTGAIAVAKVPKQYVAEGALTSTDGFDDRVLASGLTKGEQVTESKFKNVDETGLSHKIPDGMVAVSIEIDEASGVGGKLKPGDRVDVLATFNPGQSPSQLVPKDVTRIILQNIEVLETSYAGAGDKGDGIATGQPASGKKTVTLAVYPSHAEKLVFATEKGHVWLGLRQGGNDKLNKTGGQTTETVFK